MSYWLYVLFTEFIQYGLEIEKEVQSPRQWHRALHFEKDSRKSRWYNKSYVEGKMKHKIYLHD